MSRGESYFISAGEYSGDLLASDLVLAIHEVMPSFKAFGIVGDSMRRAGVEELVHQRSLAVMGVMEVAKKLAEIRMVEAYILQKISDRKPAFAILVDYPAFHLRIAEQLKLRGIPVIQYVAPKVWAWGESRVEKLRRDFSLVLGVLPFERDFFLKHKVNYKLIGSPHKDRAKKIMVNPSSLGLAGEKPIIAMLPGSRASEIQTIMPRMIEIKNRLVKKYPSAKFVLPLAANFNFEHFCDAMRLDPREFTIGLGTTKFTYEGIDVMAGMSLEVMSIADVAIVASGTATLECALLGTPMVVIYVMNPITFEMAKRKVKVPYASLVNLIAGREVVREFLQEFSIDDVAKEIGLLLGDSPERKRMIDAFAEISASLGTNASKSAAQEIKDFLHSDN